MTARYLLRMDDACHAMDRHRWQVLENMLDSFGIKPLVAVVPDNDDPELKRAVPDPMFWDKVRSWQAKGWTIAMHGYRHVMHHTKSKLILPYYERSEFAGLTFEQQAEKIRRAWQIFVSQRVEPTVWIAPAHCFDWITLQAVEAETPIRIISDGIARDQYYEKGFNWIPQQLWTLVEKKDGLWTVCLHPNTMTEQQVASLRDSIKGQFEGRIIALGDIALRHRQKSLLDRVDDVCFWQRHRILNAARKMRAIVRG